MLITPATADDPYTDDCPPVSTSMRSTMPSGILAISTMLVLPLYASG
jgi:hypothetical protein